MAVIAIGCGSEAERPVLGPSTGCKPGGEQPALRAMEGSLDVDGVVRSYVIDVPTGRSDEARPVVLAFHGFAAEGRRLRRWSMLGRMAQRRKAIVVFPNGREGVSLRGRTGRGWDTTLDDTTDVTFVRALLDRLEGEYCVDRDRVYATGMSNGAGFVSVLGCVLADRIAGIAPVAGAHVIPGCTPAGPVDVQIVHGRGDKVVPVEEARAARDWWVARNGCGEGRDEQHCRHWDACPGGKVSYCEAGQGHTWPRPAARRVMGFFGLGIQRAPRAAGRAEGASGASASTVPSTTMPAAAAPE